MTHSFTILHLSDLHARGGREKSRDRRYRVLDASWQMNLKELQKQGKIDLVCFTGDLADWGLPHEYDWAGQWLDGLLGGLNLGWDRLFLVPGNHDIDRKESGDKEKLSPEHQAFRSLRENLRRADQLQVSRWLSGEKPPLGFEQRWLDLTLSRQEAYREFLRIRNRTELLPSAKLHPRLGYRVAVQLPGIPFQVQVVGLDSSWLAGDDSDSGNLRLTEDQVGLLCSDVEGKPLPGFRLALVHHPLSDLADGTTCQTKLAESVHLLLRGHLHDAAHTVWSDPDRKLRSFAAGCLYEGDRTDHYPNSCSLIRVTCDGEGYPHEYDVRLRSFSPKGGHWFDDGGVYRNAPQGRLLIRLTAPDLGPKSDEAVIGMAPVVPKEPAVPASVASHPSTTTGIGPVNDIEEQLRFLRPYVRRLINTLLPQDSDLDAFCIDYYPDVLNESLSKKERQTKLNSLIQFCNLRDIINNLLRHCPERFNSAYDSIVKSMSVIAQQEITTEKLIQDMKPTNSIIAKNAPDKDPSQAADLFESIVAQSAVLIATMPSAPQTTLSDDLFDMPITAATKNGLEIHRVANGRYRASFVKVLENSCGADLVRILTTGYEILIQNDGQGNITIYASDGVSILGSGAVRNNRGVLTCGPIGFTTNKERWISNRIIYFDITGDNQVSMDLTDSRSQRIKIGLFSKPLPDCKVRFIANLGLGYS